MKIISFAWTTPALLAERKRVTRRRWNDDYAQRFKKRDLIAAYDKSPRAGGKQVATIRLIDDAYRGRTDYMPPNDYEAEGFAYMEEQGQMVDGMPPRIFWRAWKAAQIPVWVIRFEIVQIEPWGFHLIKANPQWGIRGVD
jgi:hypothetical protein